jgi:hypothetical protein
MLVCKDCGKEFKSVIKINGVRKKLHTRLNCLECLPYGRIKPNLIFNFKECNYCHRTFDLSYFYKNNKFKHGYSSACRKCAVKNNLQNRGKFKLKCLEYKGGKCIKCGYNKCPEAMDFHHRNPEEKSFSIFEVRTRVFDDKIKFELDKCDLLCANCHRETHREEKIIELNNLENEYINKSQNV